MRPNDNQPLDAAEVRSDNRPVPSRHIPQTVPTRLIGPNQTQNVPTSPTPTRTHHDDYPPLDTAESNLSPAEGEIHNVNLSPAGGEGWGEPFLPRPETQRGRASRAPRATPTTKKSRKEKHLPRSPLLTRTTPYTQTPQLVTECYRMLHPLPQRPAR